MKTLNEKASKKTSNTVIAAIIIVSVIVGFLFFQWISNTMQRTVAQPDIRAENVKAVPYWNGLDRRARVTGTLFNYGDADGIVSVKVFTKWDGSIRDYEVKTVLVNAHTSKDVSADLDAPELSNFLIYGIEIIEVRKA